MQREKRRRRRRHHSYSLAKGWDGQYDVESANDEVAELTNGGFGIGQLRVVNFDQSHFPSRSMTLSI